MNNKSPHFENILKFKRRITKNLNQEMVWYNYFFTLHNGEALKHDAHLVIYWQIIISRSCWKFKLGNFEERRTNLTVLKNNEVHAAHP
jgi:hypothetical protein